MLLVQDHTFITTASCDPFTLFVWCFPLSRASAYISLLENDIRLCEDVLPAFQVTERLLGIYILQGIALSQLLLYTQEYKDSSSFTYSLKELQSLTYPVFKTFPWNLTEVPIMGFWQSTHAWSVSFPTSLPTQLSDCSWE